MDILDVRKKKAQVESTIVNILVAYEKETGTVVENINMRRIDVSTATEPRTIISGLELEVRL
jgi:hypothetical protein